MEEKFYNVDGMPTKVLCCGDLSDKDEVALVIPGNPGITDFYVEFVAILHRKLGMPVGVISHAGHETIPSNTKQPHLNGNKTLYGVSGQVKHKKDFICEFLPAVKINLIGHSIGCKIILELLKHEDLNLKVKKCILLFPTIERMAESPNGRLFTCLDKYLRLLFVLCLWMLHYIPLLVKIAAIKWYSGLTHIPIKFTNTISRLIEPSVLEKVYYMGQDEMKCVKNLDVDLIKKNSNRLYFYYGTTDRWCPLKFYEEIIVKIPEAKVQLCRWGYRHAFVLSDPTKLAHIVADWIAS